MPYRVKISVPASSANMGPGFDCLGMALDLRNELEVIAGTKKKLVFNVRETAGNLGTSTYTECAGNLVYMAFKRIYDAAGFKLPAGLTFNQTVSIPTTRGLGSSAVAIISGMFAANEMCGKPFSEKQLLLEMLTMEKHPDNIMASWCGGIVVSSFFEKQLYYERYVPHHSLRCILTIPNYELSTGNSRQVLPRSIPVKDAVFNMVRLPMLLRRLVEGRFENLSHFMDDRIHQPFRKSFIPAYDVFVEEAEEFGAAATVLSGAGPTLMTLCHKDKVPQIKKRLTEVAQSVNEKIQIKTVAPDMRGAMLLVRW